jgi:hypothetical protein
MKEFDPIREFWIKHNFCFCHDPDAAITQLGGHLRDIASEKAWGEAGGGLMEYVLDSFDLTEHGTSVRCAWLSQQGRELLKAIDAYAALTQEQREGFWDSDSVAGWDFGGVD